MSDSTRPPSRTYRPEIDGLRAIAVLPVILFHAGFRAFQGGFVGVDVFFVISGYLITSILAGELASGRFSLARFYERRVRRILPALYAVIVVCVPFAWRYLLPEDATDFAQSVVAVVLFVSNVLFWRESGYFAPTAHDKPLLHTWSLAVEEQFYLLFPLLFAAAWRLGRTRAVLVLSLLGISSLVVSAVTSTTHPDAAFYLLPARAWELLLGAGAALVPVTMLSAPARPRWHHVASGIGVTAILFAVFAFDATRPYPGLAALVPTIGSALVLRYADRTSGIGVLLSHRALVAVGLISYSAYLWHQPVFAFYRYQSLATISVVEQGLLVGIVLVLAYVSWRFIESPFRHGAPFTRVSIARWSSVSAVLFVIGGAGHLTHGFRNRGDAVYPTQVERAISVPTWIPGCSERLRDQPVVGAGCVAGDTAAAPSVALIGDSHAVTVAGVLADSARAHGIRLVSYALPMCLPVMRSQPVESSEYSRACSRLRADFFRSLTTSLIPPTVVVAARWPRYLARGRFDNGEGTIDDDEPWDWQDNASTAASTADALVVDLQQSISRILESGRSVVLVYPVPEMAWNVPRRLLQIAHQAGKVLPADASVSAAVIQRRMASSVQALDGIPDSPHLTRVFPIDVFCGSALPDRCAAHVRGVPLYVDDNHLSAEGASLLVGQLFRVLPRAPGGQ